MNSAVKLLLVLVVLGIAGWFAYDSMSGDDGPGPGPSLVSHEDPGPESIDDGAPTQVVAAETTTGKMPDRAAAERVDVSSQSESNADAAQGLAGRAVDKFGAPVANAEIILRKVVPGGVFMQAIQQNQGIGNPPIGSAYSDETGVFRIGVRSTPADDLELWIVSDITIDKNISAGKLTPGDWRDLGDVILDKGCTLYGRVSDESNGAPIVGATVTAKNPMIGGLAPPPGREAGIPVVTDQNGMFRFDNLQNGTIWVSATAEGYATMTAHDVRTTPDAPSEHDFTLPVGLSIAGFVTDGEGNGLPGATISAICLSTKTPMKVDSRTDETGRFRFDGLVDAPFQLNASAVGFKANTLQPIQAGETDQQIVLEKQGGARLRVVASNGRAIKSFNVTTLRHYPQNGQMSRAAEIPWRAVRARDLEKDGSVLITGMNPGSYAFEVETGGFAKTRSEAFEIASDGVIPEVTVSMIAGGKIVGTVVGPDGNPLAGVKVKTEPKGYISIPLFAGLQEMMVTETSKKEARTDSKGRYSLEMLAPAEYQLKFDHPDTFVTRLNGVIVANEQTTEAETMRLERGTRVYGIVSVNGQPTLGVKVSISTAPVKNKPGGVPGLPGAGQDPAAAFANRFSAEALTNERGEFEFSERVPPGDYEVRAGRQAGGNPLAIMIDFQKTTQTVTLRNQDTFEFNPNILTQQ